ncbi:hypothetical protein ACQ4PT_034635 [Festuca glaucescens]
MTAGERAEVRALMATLSVAVLGCARAVAAARREQGSRIVAQLLTLMDGNRKSSKKLPHVAVVAVTNRVDAIDTALRRPGRFDSEIEVSVPTVQERLQILKRARLSAPSIIFFDEADAIAPKRTGPDGDGNAIVGESLLSTLLTEMDGLELATGIIVLAATNRPKAIDAALLRPGRFDMVLYVPPPDVQGRHEILRIKTRKMKLGEDVDLGKIAERTELFTGADLEGLCREAGMLALREDLTAPSIDKAHFEATVRSLKPSLTKAEVDQYTAAAIHGPSTRKH